MSSDLVEILVYVELSFVHASMCSRNQRYLIAAICYLLLSYAKLQGMP
ncbi:hypothetical protein LX70_02274 [Defluviimonas denitrificans]|jgi:hypothetical protein|uniref:Uncharacterized protein n=1 Tax=Albidovulum denitrificans TaxID=404881 RepID=A0A2S8S7B0_9RHOB|nr:hypothetical protein LX70_02274 [Defluviimonas denitrificans]